ncbi:MAG TPA: multidrug effflux MFS transporter [Kofleriaceae bacterium]|nr:multidrug effflux MFS transporter [Kofleriaceae bacterium]
MSRPRYEAAIGSARWIATLGALTTVAALSIDMSLPAQPTLARRFDVDDGTAQLSLSLFMLGFSAAQVFVGYLSDVWGRRPVLVAGLAGFVVAGVACALSPTIEVLLACRVLQGAGASAAPVLARAMVRDTQPAHQAARLLSTMLAALAVAPMIAPVIGGALLGALGWRWIFAMLALCGAAMLGLAHTALPETLPAERRVPPSAIGLVRNYRRFFATPGVRLPLLLSCASFAGQFAYIAVSPFVLIDGYHVSGDAFGFYFAVTALALMLGSLFGGRLLRAGRSPGAMLVTGTSLLLSGGVLVMIGTHVEQLGIAGFIVPMVIYFFGTGISSPSSTALAMEPVPHIAGTASAAVGILTMTTGALAGYETAKLGGSSPTTFAYVTLSMGVLAAAVAWTIAIGRRRRRRRAAHEQEPSSSSSSAAA